MSITEEQILNGIIVADGEYELYLAKIAEDDCDDGCHNCYNGCNGDCGVDDESCRRHLGRNKHGHFVGWCMCGSEEKARELYLQGLSVAEEYLPIENLDIYKARIETFIAEK